MTISLLTMPDERLGGSITAIEPQKTNTDRVSIFVDGEFTLGVHCDVVAKHGLHVGETLSPEKLQEIERDEDYVQAKQSALDYLAHKPRTEKEVRRKLRSADILEPVIDEVISRLYELQYLDDEAYARDYVRNRFSSKRYGPERIRRELRKRGVDRRLIDEAVHDHFSGIDLKAVAREHAEKRWSRLADEDDPRRRKQKLYRYLRRRGFPSGVISPLLDELERDVQAQ